MNAALHAGHALFITLEDIMTRYSRMRGKETLWLPGVDHAGFETQVVFEKHLEKQGKSRFDYDKKTLYKMIWDFTKECGSIIENQQKRLGASCDWSRKKFTLDRDIIKVIYDTFKKLYQDGLIYKGQRVINWCPHHQTSFSELEVVHKERKTELTYIKYPFHEKKGHIVVATVRPETILGDTAVAVNANDKRYQRLLKEKIEIKLPLTDRIIPLIADKAVDIDFGAGALKVTPAHDPIDFEISQRHKLKAIQVIGLDGKMTKEAGKNYQGLTAKKACQKVLEDLKKLNLIQKQEDYTHIVPLCYKCGSNIEPLISKQWFIKIKPLAEKAVSAVKQGKVKFVSKKFEKIYFHWMKNIKDWNISRQIVWGIKIPVWYCLEKGNKKCQNKEGIIISEKKPAKCPYCRGRKLKEETDTFDTWFSSGQWPYASLGYPNKEDYKKFYPTDVMETGWDILFFWVARMIMLGIYRTGKVPFKYVYLHGVVRDAKGKKMSKSKGNVINPLEVSDKYGADSLRMALVFGADTQNDTNLSEDKISAQAKFTTKIWNASRFILNNLKGFNPKIKKTSLKLTKEDKWILRELEKTIERITKYLDNFVFHEAAREIYHFFWHEFCDKCIENTKERLYSETVTKEEKQTAQWVLYTVLLASLKLLHPFMPYVTEVVYQKLPHKLKKMLIIEEWPNI